MDINSRINVEMLFSPDKPRATSQQGVRIIARLCSWLFILSHRCQFPKKTIVKISTMALFCVWVPFSATIYAYTDIPIDDLTNSQFKAKNAQDVNIDYVIQIESGGNPNAYNETSKCRGLMQISEIVLKEWNTRENHQVLETRDLYNKAVNITIGTWYINTRIPQMLKAYKIPDTIDNRLWAYNAGIGNVKKGIKPKETKNYIIKYRKLERGK